MGERKKYVYLKHGNKLPNEAHTNEIRMRVRLQHKLCWNITYTKRDQTEGSITHKLCLNSIYIKTGLDYVFSYNTSYCQFSD